MQRIEGEIRGESGKTHYALLFILWIIFVFTVSIISVPRPKIETKLPLDKVIHFILYGLTSVFLFKLLLMNVSRGKAIFLSILLPSLYGYSLEVVQMMIPWRTFSTGDIIANTSGTIGFMVIYSILRKYVF